jgi:hypothetical protein
LKHPASIFRVKYAKQAQAFSKADCPACSLAGLFFNPEDGGTIFLQKHQ